MEAARIEVDRQAGTYRCTITVARPATEVYAVLSDVESWPQWLPTVTSVRRAGPAATASAGSTGPQGGGPQGSYRVKQPKLATALWTVAEADAPHSFTWVNRRGGVTVIAGHRIEPVGEDSALVTLTIDQKGPLRHLVAPFTRSLTSRYMVMEAEALRRRCEAPGRPSPPAPPAGG